MPHNAVERTAEHIVESAHRVSKATRALAEALIEDGAGVVKRAAKQGGDAAEEFLDDTSERLKRHLALAIATTFAAGFATGALIGCTLKRSDGR